MKPFSLAGLAVVAAVSLLSVGHAVAGECGIVSVPQWVLDARITDVLDNLHDNPKLLSEPIGTGDEQTTLLICAARQGNEGLVDALLKMGADANASDGLGWTPLALAATNRLPGIVALLLAAGADPGKPGAEGLTPLHCVARSTHPRDALRVMGMLLEKGADVNARDFSLRTPLEIAARQGNLELVTELVGNGARTGDALAWLQKARPDSEVTKYLDQESSKRAAKEYGIGVTSRRDRAPADAIRRFLAALEYRTDHVDAHWELAQVYEQQAKAAEATEHYRAVIDLTAGTDRATEARAALKRLGLTRTSVAAGAAPPQADWSMFRGGPTRDGSAPALEPDTALSVVKTARIGDNSTSLSSPVFDPDDRVFRAVSRWQTCGIAPATGEVSWAPHGEKTDSTPCIAGGALIYGLQGGYAPYFWAQNLRAGYVHAQELDGGQLRWVFSTGGPVSSSPTPCGGSVVFGAQDGVVYSVSVQDGSRDWAYKTDGPVCSSAAIWADTVYIGSGDHFLHAVDAKTGARKWRFPTGGRVDASPTVRDGRVYIGSFDGVLYCLNAADGELIWKSDAADGWIHSTPLVADGRVYFGTGGANLHCVSAETGEPVWKFKTGRQIYSSPILLGNTVYIASDTLYGLSAETGELRWKMEWNTNQPPSKLWINSTPCVGGGFLAVRTPVGVRILAPQRKAAEPELGGGPRWLAYRLLDQALADLLRAAEAGKPLDPVEAEDLLAAANVAQPPVAERPFSDVPADYHSAAAIVSLRNRGIVRGQYGKALPDLALQRHELAAMLTKCFALLKQELPRHKASIAQGPSRLPEAPKTAAYWLNQSLRELNDLGYTVEKINTDTRGLVSTEELMIHVMRLRGCLALDGVAAAQTGPATPAPSHPAAQAWFDKFARGWNLRDDDPAVTVVCDEFRGRRDVLRTHPPHPEGADVVWKKVAIPAGKQTVLKATVSHEHGDWQLVVRVDGKTLLEKPVGQDSVGADGWLSVSVDLSEYAGKEVLVEVVNQPTGWWFETAFWAELAVVSTD